MPPHTAFSSHWPVACTPQTPMASFGSIWRPKQLDRDNGENRNCYNTVVIDISKYPHSRHAFLQLGFTFILKILGKL